MISDKISAKQSVISEINGAVILDIGDKIAALVFRGEGDTINSKTAEWAAQNLKNLENEINGVVIFGNGDNLCSKTVIDKEDLDGCAKGFQSLTTAIRHYRKPVVTLLHGESMGFGYEIALNSHAVISYPTDVKFGYDFSQGYSPMGGGLTAQIIDTYSIADNIAGLDIIPFLRTLLNNAFFPKKTENMMEAKMKGMLPNNTLIIKSGEDIIEKGKLKASNMYLEGFEPIDEKSVVVSGTTGRAALEMMVVNNHEGLFMSDEMFEIALKVAGIIGGGNVPKKAIVPEKQFLKLEAEAFADILKQNRNEVTI